MFCASCELGPAAGPNGVSMRSEKIGSAPPSYATTLRTPKMLPCSSCSLRIQSISWANGIGLMTSLIVGLLSHAAETARRHTVILAPRRPKARPRSPPRRVVHVRRTRALARAQARSGPTPVEGPPRTENQYSRPLSVPQSTLACSSVQASMRSSSTVVNSRSR